MHLFSFLFFSFLWDFKAVMDPAAADGIKKAQQGPLMYLVRVWVAASGNAECNKVNGWLGLFLRFAQTYMNASEKKVNAHLSSMLCQVHGVIDPKKTKQGLAQKAIGAGGATSRSEKKLHNTRSRGNLINKLIRTWSWMPNGTQSTNWMVRRSCGTWSWIPNGTGSQMQSAGGTMMLTQEQGFALSTQASSWGLQSFVGYMQWTTPRSSTQPRLDGTIHDERWTGLLRTVSTSCSDSRPLPSHSA